jgi:hypothetical protein
MQTMGKSSGKGQGWGCRQREDAACQQISMEYGAVQVAAGCCTLAGVQATRDVLQVFVAAGVSVIEELGSFHDRWLAGQTARNSRPLRVLAQAPHQRERAAGRRSKW